MKESEWMDEYLELAREPKLLWNMKVVEIPIGIDTVGTVPNVLEKRMELLEIRGTIDTILTTALKYSEESCGD